MIRFCPADGCLDLAQTLDCGQAFRWQPVLLPDGRTAWRGIAFGRALTVWQEDDAFCFDCTEEEFQTIWYSYFDFDTDYAALRAHLSALHPVLKDACGYAPGIRILRQEPWEALCSFIISQNNNIQRIKGIVDRLCSLSGDPIICGDTTLYAFPTPAQLAACTLEDLAPLRAGFRAKYLLDAARRVSSGDICLEALHTAPIEDAKQALMTIHGVGPKVADCALLYGLHRTCCFPMDVWMKRAVQLLPGITPESLGNTAGIAQQYLFHYVRMHPEVCG